MAGGAYDKGDGVPPDQARAKSLYGRGCGLHSKASCAKSR
jgi:TPR repeat protein